MKPYGLIQNHIYEIPPLTISKKSARQLEKDEIQEHLDSNLFDLWGCDDDCPYCGDWLSVDCPSPLCGCEDCNPRSLNEGKGWKKC